MAPWTWVRGFRVSTPCTTLAAAAGQNRAIQRTIPTDGKLCSCVSAGSTCSTAAARAAAAAAASASSAAALLAAQDDRRVLRGTLALLSILLARSSYPNPNPNLDR